MPARHHNTGTAVSGTTEGTPPLPLPDPHDDPIAYQLALMRQRAIDEAEEQAAIARIAKHANQQQEFEDLLETPLFKRVLRNTLTNRDISGIILPEMQEVEPNTVVEVRPATPMESTVEVQNEPCSTDSLPWSATSTPDEIGRTALTAVQDLEARRAALKAEIRDIKEQQIAIVLAAKDAGHFSWSSLAKVFGLNKGRMVQLYDRNTINATSQSNQRHYKRLREDAAKARQEAS